MKLLLERYFEFERLGTNWRTEILAGFTTFMTMAYIVLVNPAILHEAGMPLAGVFAATCISAALGTLLMGAFAKVSDRACAGDGIERVFHPTVVKGMGVPWETGWARCFFPVWRFWF